MKISEVVSARIREIVNSKNISLYNVCKNSGIPQSTFNGLIYGKNKSVYSNTLYSILRTLDINLDEFFDSPLFNDENLDFP